MKQLHAAGTLLAVLILLASCQKKMCTSVRTITTPVWKSRADIRAAMHAMPAQTIGATGKLYIYGNYIFLNEPTKGVHIIDNSNPAAPVNKAFVPIPGNVDIAVRGNYLYADCWADLVVLDVSNPLATHPVSFASNVYRSFNNYYYTMMGTNGDTLYYAGVETHDTVVNCRDEYYEDRISSPVIMTATLSNATFTGAGGSMSRFALVNDRLYAVDDFSLSTFSVSNPAQLVGVGNQIVGTRVETIYPMGNKLFIGTATGMHIYDISNANNPSFLSTFSHATACDPVIADGQYAYVTLRSGTACNTINNELNVVNIANLTSPQLVRTYAMTNPHGLTKDGNLLFICDGRDGIRMMDASSPNNIMPLFRVTGIDTYDAIAMNGTLIVSAKDGLYQYDYRSGARLTLLSKIEVKR